MRNITYLYEEYQLSLREKHGRIHTDILNTTDCDITSF